MLGGGDTLGPMADHEPRNQDPIASLQDTDAEQGDEAEVDDDFDLDRTEARELGVDLDQVDGAEEPRLD